VNGVSDHDAQIILLVDENADSDFLLFRFKHTHMNKGMTILSENFNSFHDTFIQKFEIGFLLKIQKQVKSEKSG
jgi:hypothetical protein